jgi:hypothetical protein
MTCRANRGQEGLVVGEVATNGGAVQLCCRPRMTSSTMTTTSKTPMQIHQIGFV